MEKMLNMISYGFRDSEIRKPFKKNDRKNLMPFGYHGKYCVDLTVVSLKSKSPTGFLPQVYGQGAP
jgi:hypothetical protein